jgi:hypothetical protein
MSAEPLTPPPVSPPPPSPSPTPSRVVRLEYVDFQDVAEYREFRLRVRTLDGSNDVRVRIPIAAFHTGRLRLQDGPDICYQKLLQAEGAGDTASPDTITIDDVELARYADGHKSVQKHRSWSSSSPTDTASPADPAAVSPTPRAAPAVASGPAPVLEGGQRVSHAVFGLGVMSPPSGGRTVVSFDDNGPKTFITSLLEVDLLSAPHTWETTPRGKNRPCS